MNFDYFLSTDFNLESRTQNYNINYVDKIPQQNDFEKLCFNYFIPILYQKEDELNLAPGTWYIYKKSEDEYIFKIMHIYDILDYPIIMKNDKYYFNNRIYKDFLQFKFDLNRTIFYIKDKDRNFGLYPRFNVFEIPFEFEKKLIYHDYTTNKNKRFLLDPEYIKEFYQMEIEDFFGKIYE